MLLREIQVDDQLSSYSVIMLDEAASRTHDPHRPLFGIPRRFLRITDPIWSSSSPLRHWTRRNQQTNFFGCSFLSIPGRVHHVEILYSREPVTEYFGKLRCAQCSWQGKRRLRWPVKCYMRGYRPWVQKCRSWTFMPSIVLSRLKCRHKSSHSEESGCGNQQCGGSSHNVAESNMLWILALQSRVFMIQSLTWILWSSLQSPKALRLSELDAREEQSRTSATDCTLIALFGTRC